MSDTPRTDAYLVRVYGKTGTVCAATDECAHPVYVMADTARELERELAAAKAEIANLKGALEATNAKLRDVNELGWETVADAEAEIAALRLLAQFGAWCLETLRESFGDIDGGSAQDEAQRLGILVNVHVTEPCGESCSCAEYDDFPQECLRYSEQIRAAIAAARKS